MKTFLIIPTFLVALLPIFAFGQPKADRDHFEYWTAVGIANRLNSYAVVHPKVVVTNLTQLLEEGGVDWWLKMEDGLRASGNPSSNIMEMFVPIVPNVQVGDSIGGEIRFVGYHPYEASDGRTKRAVIAQMDTGRYRGVSVEDNKLQSWMSAAGVTIPDPPKHDPIPRPPKQRTVADMSPAEVERLLNGPDALRLETHSEPAEGSRKTTPSDARPKGASTNAVIAITDIPSAPTRWWLPVAVFAGLGVIAFLLLRARRRKS